MEKRADSADHTWQFDAVFCEEIDRIRRVRSSKDAAPHEPLAALALSGGGIRSAAFALGVLQAFANEGVLRRFDYLSTVSGGGYIGSALTWFLSEPWKAANGARRGTGPEDHPLGRRGIGAKTGAANDRIDHIRGFGNYLRPTSELWTGSALALIVQDMLFVVFLWFCPLVLAFLLIDWTGKGLAGVAWASEPLGQHLSWLGYLTGLFALLALLQVYWTPSRIARHFDTHRTGQGKVPSWDPTSTIWAYRGRLARQITLGLWLALGVSTGLVALLPRLVGLVDSTLATTGSVAALAGLIPTLLSVGDTLGARPRLKGLALRVGVVLLALGLLALAVALPEQGARSLQPWLGTDLETARRVVFWSVVALAVLAGLLSLRPKLNHLSAHRLYRDRLMEAFLPDPRTGDPQEDDPGSPAGGDWRPAVGADTFSLHEACDEGSKGPYHLVNANIILVGSRNSVVRNRGGESFLMSPLWTGCDRTGWHRTRTLINRGQPLTLATAMAVSGAAATPNAGAAGRGMMRAPLIRQLMMLFNMRLAFWLPNPAATRRAGVRLAAWLGRKDMGRQAADWLADNRPSFAYPGLAAVLGLTHTEGSAYVEISDGGHFENLGVYELLRRRVPLIVVSDAGMDPGPTFEDLANLIERARVDLGVEIEFAWPEVNLEGVRPCPATAEGAGPGPARRGWALARIIYPKPPTDAHFHAAMSSRMAGEERALVATPDGTPAYLVYLKPTLCADLSPELLWYSSAHPEFPHETTGDQFFDEAQFEAYRELGYGTCLGLLKEGRNLLDRVRSAAVARGESEPLPPGPVDDLLPRRAA